jgi:hypothetical protein
MYLDIVDTYDSVSRSSGFPEALGVEVDVFPGKMSLNLLLAAL